MKHFDGWHHLVTMLYATIMRYDSLREIQASMTAESRKLSHLGLTKIPRRSTLSDANKRGKKKGGLKVHTIINANEGVPCDVQFTSAATHDHFLLCPSKLNRDDIVALDRAYIDYAKFEEMTQRGTVYVTKMKKNLVFEILNDVIYQEKCGKMALRVQHVVFTKKTKSNNITHHVQIITYPALQKRSSYPY